MTVTQAFRYELDPTKARRSLLSRAAGTARYAYNWGLAYCKRCLDSKQPVPHAAELHRLWNVGKPQRSWVYGASKCCGVENSPVKPAVVKQESPSRKLAASAVGNRMP